MFRFYRNQIIEYSSITYIALSSIFAVVNSFFILLVGSYHIFAVHFDIRFPNSKATLFGIGDYCRIP